MSWVPQIWGFVKNTSDIDFVVYVRCDPDFEGGINSCEQYKNAEKIIEKILSPQYAFQILDAIDLNVVEKAIREKNYEDEMTMRLLPIAPSAGLLTIASSLRWRIC